MSPQADGVRSGTARETLGRRERLRSSSTYARCYKEGRRVRDDLTGAFFLPEAVDSPGPSGASRGPRLGVTVTKKFGGSVARHRAKRWAREIFRRSSRRRRLPAGDLVLHIYPASRTASFHDMKQSIEAQLSRLVAGQPRRRRRRARG